MVNAKVIAIAVITIVVGSVVGYWLYVQMPTPDEKTFATLPIQFTAIDRLAGGTDAATTEVEIFLLEGGYHVSQETVTMTAANTESANEYTTLDVLYLKIDDTTDTSLCTIYKVVTVPYASFANIYDNAFQLKLKTTDRGNTAKDIAITEANGTAIADAATVDCSNSGYDSAYASWDFDLKAMDDDSGYVNSDNFLKGYGNNHYLVLDAVGTGWDSVTLLSTAGWQIYERASTRYFVYPLSDTDLTRDLQSAGVYDPTGRITISVTFDLTGITSGDSVTLDYQYMWYSSFENFKATGSWGSDTAETEETITITP